jgi:Nif-specific ferredoxin III
MAVITGLTRGGTVWTPEFLDAVDGEKCIACGRCFKICGRGVLELIPRGEDGDEEGGKVMSVATPYNCIGCGACSRACSKKSLRFVEI